MKEKGYNDTFNDAKDVVQSLSDTAYPQLHIQALQAPPPTKETFSKSWYLSCLNRELQLNRCLFLEHILL